MKLPNGYGSVYKLSGKRRKPWAVAKTVNWTDEGKQMRKIVAYATSRSEALRILAEFNNDPYDIDLSKITMKELYDKWIKEIEKKVNEDKLSKKRLDSYRWIFGYYKEIENMVFSSINNNHLQKIIDECKNGYTTKIIIKTMYNQLFTYAKKKDIPLKKNYSEFIDIGNQKKSTLHKPFSEPEILKLWDNINLIQDVDTILIMCNNGMRVGELINIKLDNIHLEERYMIGGSKTAAGRNRIIPINDDIYPFIEKRYYSNKEYLIEYNGHNCNYLYYKRIFSTIMNKLDMNHLPYDCRHYFATAMDNLGANKICTKLIMGHTIVDITDGTYTHKSIQDLLDTVNLLKKENLEKDITEKV